MQYDGGVERGWRPSLAEYGSVPVLRGLGCGASHLSNFVCANVMWQRKVSEKLPLRNHARVNSGGDMGVLL